MCDLLIGILVLIIGYIVYKKLTYRRPSLPQLDYDLWWGPDSKKQYDNDAIRPFKIEFKDEVISDLKQRLKNHRPFADALEGVAFEYGFNSNLLKEIIDYWQNRYDFKSREKLLNQYNHFKTTIQGLDIHYIHVKPDVSGVEIVPLLLLHGWPGSVREFYELIPLLTNKSDGRDFAFELIIPSLPGFGFSDAPVKQGFSQVEAAIVMRNLMKRLGFKKFYIQGGDWGSSIGGCISTIFPDEVLGFHSNLLIIITPTLLKKWIFGAYFPWLYKFEENRYRDRVYPISKIFAFIMEGFGYFHLQATYPDTVGFALTDSPSGLAAYILEKFVLGTNFSFRHLQDGGLETKFTTEQLLDNLMFYWVSNNITSSLRIYAESNSRKARAIRMNEIVTNVPVWGMKNKNEILHIPDHALKEKYPNLLGSTVNDHGGHFAALEMPQTLADDILKAVWEFRRFHKINHNDE